ncbi:MAG TPA: TlpA disulfide reductase family protein [Longilinea sp.]|nr:TlpA disulfide reductase family protein [Longilinea sp.]
MKWRRLLLLLGVLALSVLIILAFIHRVELLAWVTRNAGSIPEVGKDAPDFSLKDLNGETVRLDDFHGKVVVVNFWATWCIPCREEMPLLQQFSVENFQDVVVLGIDLDEPRDLVASYTKQFQIDFPVLLDAGSKVADRYFIHGFPTTIVVDTDGKIMAIHIGKLTQENLMEFMEQAAQSD